MSVYKAYYIALFSHYLPRKLPRFIFYRYTISFIAVLTRVQIPLSAPTQEPALQHKSSCDAGLLLFSGAVHIFKKRVKIAEKQLDLTYICHEICHEICRTHDTPASFSNASLSFADIASCSDLKVC